MIITNLKAFFTLHARFVSFWTSVYQNTLAQCKSVCTAELDININY